MEITEQEAWTERDGRPLDVPGFIKEVVERIAFEARSDKRVDGTSGVSQRLPISALESVISSAEQRSIVTKEKRVVPRISDIYGALPAITGKIELEYEGELQGAETIARDLVRRAAGETFDARLGGLDCDAVIEWFDEGGALKVAPNERSDLVLKGFSTVAGLLDAVKLAGLAPGKDPATIVAACELILEGLVAHRRISRSDELGYSRVRTDRPPGYGTGLGGSVAL